MVRNGTGAACALCSEAIRATEVEYEARAESMRRAQKGMVRSHPSCFQVWKAEAEGFSHHRRTDSKVFAVREVIV
jgi:hypothetical protein